MGAGLGKTTCLITDGRFSGASHGFIIGKSAATSRPSTVLIRSFIVHQATLYQKPKSAGPSRS